MVTFRREARSIAVGQLTWVLTFLVAWIAIGFKGPSFQSRETPARHSAFELGGRTAPLGSQGHGAASTQAVGFAQGNVPTTHKSQPPLRPHTPGRTRATGWERLHAKHTDKGLIFKTLKNSLEPII